MDSPHDDLPGRGLTRRDLLRWGGGGALVTVSFSGALSGCGFFSTDPGSAEKAGAATGKVAKGKEAPELAEQVKAGKLPPVAERMPTKPLVIQPVERIGEYGGEWNSAVLGPADRAWPYRTIGYEHMLNWDIEWKKPIPNIAEAVEVDDEAREYTFHLREGMKWSDGEPYTADDIVFGYEDFLLNKELNPQSPEWLLAGGKPGKLEKIDDLTVRFVFAATNGLFLENIAQPAGERLTSQPRHYLEQFHKKYNPDVDKLAEEQNLGNWIDLYVARGGEDGPWGHVGLPRITAWVVTEPLGEGTRMIAERNPYYWKTDPDGSQLPYIDKVVYDVINEEEAMVLKATNGELDFHDRHINSTQNKPVIAAGREKGNYHFVEETGSSMNSLIIALNLTHKDPKLREVFQNRDFRIGLSHAINREEMIKAVFQRQGEPWQAAPRPESPYYDEKMAKQYTEFDVDLANEFLDKAYPEKDGQGMRLRPDGERITFQVEVGTGLSPTWIDGMELIRGYWNKVGVDGRVKGIDRDLMYERKEANDQDANVWGGDGGLADGLLDPRWFFPFSLESNYAIAWANWFLDATPQMEPPARTKQQMAMYRELATTPDAEGRDAIFKQILQIAKEEFYVIGTVLPPKGYAIVKNDFHNLPRSLLNAWMYPGPGPTMPEQYFISGS